MGRAGGRRPRPAGPHGRGLRRLRRLARGPGPRRRRRRLPHRRPQASPGRGGGHRTGRGRSGAGRRRALGDRGAVARRGRGCTAQPLRHYGGRPSLPPGHRSLDVARPVTRSEPEAHVIAEPAVQLRLLDLQAADTALNQLAHRRTHLPELAAIAERGARAGELYDAVIDARTRLDDLATEQKRLEADVETVRARTTRDESRLQAGGLPSRELESLQHEIATLARRQSTLEDELLDVMEQAEEAESALAEATVRHEALVAEQRELEGRRDAAFAEIDAAIAQRTPER